MSYFFNINEDGKMDVRRMCEWGQVKLIKTDPQSRQLLGRDAVQALPWCAKIMWD